MQFFAIPQNAKGVRTQAIAHWLANRDRRCRCHGCIHCIAAFEHHAQARLRSERVRSAHHVAGEEGDAGGGVGVGKIEVHWGRIAE